MAGPLAAGAMPLGWYGGCVVLTDQPSGVTCPPPPLTTCTAASRADGDPGRFSSLPSASSRARMRGRRVLVPRRAGAHQVLVVQVGAAERAHEEVVGQRVLLRPPPDLQRAAVVMAHHPAADVGHRGEQVVAAAVDLLLVVVEGVDRARHEGGGRPAHRRRVDAERPVRQAREARIGLAIGTEHHQFRQRGAIVVTLHELLRCRLRDPVRAGEQAVHVVEAVVLGVDHHHVADALHARGDCRIHRWRARGTAGHEEGCQD